MSSPITGASSSEARPRTGLRFRLTALMVLVVAVIMGTFSVGILATISSFLRDRVDDQLLVIGESGGKGLMAELAGERGNPLPPVARGGRQLQLAGTPAGTTALVMDRANEVQIAWDLSAGARLDPSDQNVRSLAIDGSKRRVQPDSGVTFTAHGRRVLVVGVSQRRADDLVLVVAMPLTEVDQTIDRLRVALIVGSAGAVLAAALLGTLFVRVGLLPLTKVTQAARRIAGGERGIRVGAHNPNTEVGALAIAFDTMLGELETAVSTAQHSEAKIRRFVADAAHELRTPLASVRGHAELLRRGMADPTDTAQVAGRIEDGTIRLGSLVDQMLTLARLDASAPLDMVALQLSDIVAEAIVDADVRHPSHRFAMNQGVTPANTAIEGDPLRLRQMIDNLLANAGRHTPDGTDVEVEIDRVEGGPHGPVVRVVVADSGPGFAPTGGADVFERFVRADQSRTRDTGGSGLGLAIVRGVAEAHGGSVRILEASPLGGAAVEVRIPVDGGKTALNKAALNKTALNKAAFNSGASFAAQVPTP